MSNMLKAEERAYAFLGFEFNIMKPAKFNIIKLILTHSATCSQRCGIWLGAKTTSQIKHAQISFLKGLLRLPR